MGKSNDVGMLIIDPPEELVLEGPLHQAICKKIVVSNPSKISRVAFKLKTTTPRLFFVRPNVGVVMPEETVTIDIFVHPISPDQNVQRHKFLMQAAEADGDIGDLTEFWKNVPPPSIWDTKIKVKLVDSKKMSGMEATLKSPLVLADGENMEGHQTKDTNDPLAKLLQQINELEEERQQFKKKVELLQKEKDELTSISLKQKKKWGRGTWCLVVCAFTIAVVVGFFYTENLK